MGFIDRLKMLLGSGGNGSGGPDQTGSAPEPEGEEVACRQITCMEALERVHEYLDGELDGVSHEEVARHFAMCQRCYPHLKLEERFREVLHRIEAKDEAPQHLREQVLELLATEVDGSE